MINFLSKVLFSRTKVRIEILKIPRIYVDQEDEVVRK